MVSLPHCSWASLPEAAYEYKMPILSPETDNLLFLNQQKRDFFSMKQCADAYADLGAARLRS